MTKKNIKEDAYTSTDGDYKSLSEEKRLPLRDTPLSHFFGIITDEKCRLANDLQRIRVQQARIVDRSVR